MPDETLGTIEISDLIESNTNPRRNLNGPALEELTKSVGTHGVLQPILVRRIKGKIPFEIVAGHRRFAAAKKAGLTKLPSFIREISDKEVLEIQVIENVLRSDLHPLEEADGYRQLVEKHGYQVEQLADRVGKSKAYVYARMKLCALVKGPRAAFLEGKLDASTALLIARIPGQLQEKALKEILSGGRGFEHGEPMSYRIAAAHVHEHFMLKLSAAPFDPKDANLVPAAGTCGACPKRSGNQPELFGDVKSADVCTDPICYGKKRDAAWEAETAAAEVSGRTVLSATAAKKAFETWDPSRLHHNSGYIDLDAHVGWEYDPTGQRKTWRQLLKRGLAGDEQATIVLARDPSGGRHELLEKSSLDRVLKAAGVKRARQTSPRSSTRSTTTSQLSEYRITAEARGEILVAIEAAAAKLTPEKFLRAIAPEVAFDRKALDKVKDGPISKLQAHIALQIAEDIDAAGVAKALGIDIKPFHQAARERLKNKGKKAKPGTCSKCGCTEEAACEGGCGWANKERTLCTSCEDPNDQRQRLAARAKPRGKKK